VRKSSHERAHLLREARNAAPQRSLLIFGVIAPLAFVNTLVKGKQHFIDQCRSTCHTSCCGGLPAVVAQFCSQGLAEVKLVYAKNAEWLLSGPHQLQKFAQ